MLNGLQASPSSLIIFGARLVHDDGTPLSALDQITGAPARPVRIEEHYARALVLSDSESNELIKAIENSNNPYLNQIVNQAMPTDAPSARWITLNAAHIVCSLECVAAKELRGLLDLWLTDYAINAVCIRAANGVAQLQFGPKFNGVNQDLYVLKRDAAFHSVVVGTTGKGRSLLLETAAKQAGLTTKEYLEATKPTPEQIAAQEHRQAEAEAKRKRQSDAVKKAYLDHMDEGELGRAQDILSNAGVLDEPSAHQARVFLEGVPPSLFGLIVAWGIHDTVVRDNLFELAEERKDALRATLQQTQVTG